MKKIFIVSVVICMLITNLVFSSAIDTTDISFQPDGTTNIALGKTITISSSVDNWGWGSTFLNDGKIVSAGENGWTTDPGEKASAEDPAWFQIDLGQKSDISRIILWPRQDDIAPGACFPVDYTIQISDDGENWTTIASETNQVNVGKTEHKFDFSTPKTGRYIKFNCSKRGADNNGDFLVQLSEIAVYGVAQTETQPDTFDSNVIFAVAVIMMVSAFCLKLLSNKRNSYI